MPWQRLVADVGGELLPSGQPAFREVIVTVPRQSGKTTLLLSWELHRALAWGSPQHIVYSAQTAADARYKLIEEQVPLIDRHKGALAVARIFKTNGAERVTFKNGSRITILASSEESGHGRTIDLGVKDELFADQDFRRDQALIPAMATRSLGQILTASTAGTEASVPLNQAMERGREAVERGVRTGIAYFEWSAAEGDDLDDPESWWSFMPALGRTIDEGVVMHAKATMSPGEFRRAFGNVATVADERIIPAAVWDAVTSPTITPDGRFAFAVEVTADRSSGAIVVSDDSGRVEVLEHRTGPGGWLVDRAVEFALRQGAPVALDPSGPAGTFWPELEARVPVVDVGAREVGQACGAIYDDIMEGRAAFRRHSGLDAAVAGARKRAVGDAWRWDRKDGADVTPLMAATLARWVAMHQPEPPVVGFVNLADHLPDDWDDEE